MNPDSFILSESDQAAMIMARFSLVKNDQKTKYINNSQELFKNNCYACCDEFIRVPNYYPPDYWQRVKSIIGSSITIDAEYEIIRPRELQSPDNYTN